MPMLSIISVVCLSPAVSINLKLIPLMVMVSSIASRVVPAISETMAFSSFSILFNSVDFPTFGFPTIATGTPCLITLPYLNDSNSLVVCRSILLIKSLSWARSANSTSSSLKSSSSSISEIKCSNLSRSILSSLENPPLI